MNFSVLSSPRMWSARYILGEDFPEFTDMQQRTKNALLQKMVNAAEEDRKEVIRQGALDRIVKYFGDNDHIVKYLDIEDVRHLAELEEMRRIHH